MRPSTSRVCVDEGGDPGDQNLGALDGERPDRSVGAHASIEQAVDQALTARESASGVRSHYASE